MNAKERENVETMKRRLTHIESRSSNVASKHYDHAEALALRWALGVIAVHFVEPSAVAPERTGAAV